MDLAPTSDPSRADTDADLRRLLAQRTAELERLKFAICTRDEEQQETARQLAASQDQLRRLSLELSLTEARERRDIAEDLHDHIGQALAFVKMKVSQFRGNAVFCGFEDSIGEVITLLDQTIAYTRSLTLQLCPPVLSQAGFLPALDWLAEQMHNDHGLPIHVDHAQFDGVIDNERSLVLFRSVKELLTNAVRHSGCRSISVTVGHHDRQLMICVTDDGHGFDADRTFQGLSPAGKFGLFSVRERMRLLGGDVALTSGPAQGTKVELRLPFPSPVSASHE
ncbi:MAG: sensor histidine kinase [Candidatus Zixiibacteriota bacterium]